MDSRVIDEYFRALYLSSPLDRHGVLAEREALNFATVASRVRLIDEATHALVVPWGDAAECVRDFENAAGRSALSPRQAARALQPSVVQLFESELRGLEALGAVAPVDGFGYELLPPFHHLYHGEFGLTLDQDAVGDTAAYII
jgi:hypothetical protein